MRFMLFGAAALMTSLLRLRPIAASLYIKKKIYIIIICRSAIVSSSISFLFFPPAEVALHKSANARRHVSTYIHIYSTCSDPVYIFGFARANLQYKTSDIPKLQHDALF